MPLSCSCDDDDSDWDWRYSVPRDYTTLNTSRRKRCASCQALIDIGAVCIEFPRERRVRHVAGWCDSAWVDCASMFHCETCADLWFSLFELGFECVGPNESMRETVREYADIFSPTAPPVRPNLTF